MYSSLAIGQVGASNAALPAIVLLSPDRPELREKLRRFRADQAESVMQATLP